MLFWTDTENDEHISWTSLNCIMVTALYGLLEHQVRTENPITSDGLFFMDTDVQDY